MNTEVINKPGTRVPTEDNLGISVVMAVYHKDKPEFVIQAIESILSQTYMPHEFMIVVDGPVGEKLNQSLSQYEDNALIKILRLPENKGLAHALNKGIALSRYPLIARMDADDISCKDRLKLQIAPFKKHPETDVLGGNLLEFQGTDIEVRTVRSVPEHDKEIKKRGRLICPMNHPTVIFRKDKFLEVGGYNEEVFPEDYYLWLRMFQHGLKFHNLQKPLLFMRVDQGMFNRRSGKVYLKKELNFLKISYKENLLPLPYYLIHVVMRSSFRLLPVHILERTYVRFFRNSPSPDENSANH